VVSDRWGLFFEVPRNVRTQATNRISHSPSAHKAPTDALIHIVAAVVSPCTGVPLGPCRITPVPKKPTPCNSALNDPAYIVGIFHNGQHGKGRSQRNVDL
jgi:hypothetical protein